MGFQRLGLEFGDPHSGETARKILERFLKAKKTFHFKGHS